VDLVLGLLVVGLLIIGLLIIGLLIIDPRINRPGNKWVKSDVIQLMLEIGALPGANVRYGSQNFY
jgi:hypothetical protein